MKYHFLIPVWGESYLKVFTEFSLPTQLSPGNLGAFVREPHALYKIVTRSVDIPHIEASRSFQILKSMMATEFVPIDPYLMLSPYRIFSKCHELGVLSSAGSVGDTVFFFGVADGVWSDGSLRRAKEIIDSGKRAVLVSGGFHVVQETFCPELRAAFFKANTPVLSCPPRQLLDLAFKHIQIITRSMMWDNGQVVNRM